MGGTNKESLVNSPNPGQMDVQSQGSARIVTRVKRTISRGSMSRGTVFAAAFLLTSVPMASAHADSGGPVADPPTPVCLESVPLVSAP